MDAINPAKINKTHHTGAKVKMENFEDKLSKMIKSLLNRAEREVCEYGSFKTVKENLPALEEKDIVKEVTLQVTNLPRVLKENTKDFEKLRYLELVGIGSKGQRESVILKRGTKEEILKTLKDEKLLNRIIKNAEEFKTSFLED